MAGALKEEEEGGRSLCGGEGSEALFGQGWWRGMKGGGGGYVPQRRGERESSCQARSRGFDYLLF